MFYLFRQNNSGGRFHPPAVIVAVESNSPQEANRIAEANGLYFNGVDNDLDCSCCGDRWYPIWGEDNTSDGYTIVTTEGEVTEIAADRANWAEEDNIPAILFIKKT